MGPLLKTMLVALAFTFVATSSSAAHAGDCKGVKFKFTNKTGAKIKVRYVYVEGNDGDWSEDINNKQITTNTSYTTNKRRMNKLDSGKLGDFLVRYDRWDAKNNKWTTLVGQSFDNLKCFDNKTFSFTLTSTTK